MLELINEKRSEYMMAESLYIENEDNGEIISPYPSQAPLPAPPAIYKFQLYNDPIEFAHVDQIAISVSMSTISQILVWRPATTASPWSENQQLYEY